MFRLFQPPPIKQQIALYVAWKAIRFPLVASTHHRVLTSFFTSTRIRTLQEITPELLRNYCNKYPAHYQRLEFEKVIRQFSKYWRKMGELSVEFADFMGESTIVDINDDISPTMHIDQVKRVRELRAQGYSLNQVKLKMETEDGKPYHLKQIHRWSKYLLPHEKRVIHRQMLGGG